MKIRLVPFNIHLCVLLMGLLLGCKTGEERKKSKEASTLRLYLESDEGGHSGGVSVYRASPVQLSVDREPFLTEADLESAAVVEARGGFALQAQFNGHGALVLEGVTVAHKGRHIAIQSFFGESRWLAAPLITRRIANGELVFT